MQHIAEIQAELDRVRERRRAEPDRVKHQELYDEEVKLTKKLDIALELDDPILHNLKCIMRHADMCIAGLDAQIAELTKERQHYIDSKAAAQQLAEDHEDDMKDAKYNGKYRG